MPAEPQNKKKNEPDAPRDLAASHEHGQRHSPEHCRSLAQKATARDALARHKTERRRKKRLPAYCSPCCARCPGRRNPHERKQGQPTCSRFFYKDTNSHSTLTHVQVRQSPAVSLRAVSGRHGPSRPATSQAWRAHTETVRVGVYAVPDDDSLAVRSVGSWSDGTIAIARRYLAGGGESAQPRCAYAAVSFVRQQGRIIRCVLRLARARLSTSAASRARPVSSATVCPTKITGFRRPYNALCAKLLSWHSALSDALARPRRASATHSQSKRHQATKLPRACACCAPAGP
jgi:hypothetical protein